MFLVWHLLSAGNSCQTNSTTNVQFEVQIPAHIQMNKKVATRQTRHDVNYRKAPEVSNLTGRQNQPHQTAVTTVAVKLTINDQNMQLAKLNGLRYNYGRSLRRSATTKMDIKTRVRTAAPKRA